MKSWLWIIGPSVNVKMPNKGIDETVARVAKISCNQPKDLKVYVQSAQMQWTQCWHTAEVTK